MNKLIPIFLLVFKLQAGVEENIPSDSVTASIPSVQMPTDDLGGLIAIPDNTPEKRTQASIASEVLDNESKLNYLYKRWVIHNDMVDVDHNFNLVITINGNGSVAKAVVKNVIEPDFADEVQKSIMTWSFSEVKDSKPVTASLKNLDFTYRKERVIGNQ